MYQFLEKTDCQNHWKKIGTNRRAGVIFPLLSIYSKKSCGVGEIPDLKLAIDWCNKTNHRIMQLLPLNDTGPISSPFSPQTSIGLNPIYISLFNLKSIKIKESEINKLKSNFSNKKTVNYQIKEEKIKILKKNWEKAKLSNDFFEFIKKNKGWLDDYSLFLTIKEDNKGKSWKKWENKKLINREERTIKKFKKKNKKKILFWKWIQWELFNQLKEVKDYAKDKNVLIKGDLPLFVLEDSVDCWSNQKYFKMDLVSGATPDSFSKDGQRWDMPIYNWDNIEKDDFYYIKKKLNYAENFYDLFRIDHVIGLFRVWSIPKKTPKKMKGKIGFFSPQEKTDQIKQGQKILKEIIKGTKMLPCAEDLGNVPSFCKKTLEKMGIPGIDIKKWTKNYRRLAISTLSTHDTPLFPEWIKKKKYNHELEIKEVLSSSCIFNIFLIFELLFLNNTISINKAKDFRLNFPGKKLKKNWLIKMPLTMEELIESSVNEKIKKMIEESKRS